MVVRGLAALRILVVDDEEKIRDLVITYLLAEGYDAEGAADGRQAVRALSQKDFDLVILDLMMPGMDGWSVCREIRKSSDIPVIILTARGDEIDRVLGLELGADDYVVKPFSPRELVARVKAVLRRARKQEPEAAEGEKDIQHNGLRINRASRKVTVNGRLLQLTPKEYDLMLNLAGSPGRVFTREQLLENVWGYNFFGEARTVDTHITRLREKISRVPGARQYIHTVWGVGYKFEVEK
ncbi:response regulator transcription factor [Desulfocucumis palustris]|uniref:response regulator transcription factor n=1 Tax=Desulfocucumis palustris TaxID=1898651 RepID=UPI0022B0D8D9|nr:response regulator transcription factor [Desulfocucumis palustris]